MSDFFNFMRSIEKSKTNSNGSTSASPSTASSPSPSKLSSTEKAFSPSNTSFPAASSQQRAPSSTNRNKEPLAPNHSPMDWGKLKSSSTNLKGSYVPGMKLTLSEVSKHNTEKDAWCIIRGKVYNISPYLRFHPGGVSQLMRVAGADGTKLFTSIHSWINVEMLLDKCLLGPLES